MSLGLRITPLEKSLSRRGRRWNRTTQKLQTFFLTRSLSQGSRERMAELPTGPVKLHFFFLCSALADHHGVWSRREGGLDETTTTHLGEEVSEGSGTIDRLWSHAGSSN